MEQVEVHDRPSSVCCKDIAIIFGGKTIEYFIVRSATFVFDPFRSKDPAHSRKGISEYGRSVGSCAYMFINRHYAFTMAQGETEFCIWYHVCLALAILRSWQGPV